MRSKLDFGERGFAVLEDVFPLSDMQALAGLIDAHHERHEARLRDVGTEGISRAGEIAFTCHLAEQDPEICSFVKRPELVEITTQALGPDVDLYWNQSVFKGPHGDKEFPWHQDDGYFAVDPSPYLTLWLAINEATVQNGCIWVLPGSHRKGLLPHVQTPIGLSCHSLEDADQGVPVPLRAGSIAAFPSLMVHKSGVNRTAGWRRAFVIQYSKAGTRAALTGELLPDKIAVSRNGAPVRPLSPETAQSLRSAGSEQAG